MAPTPIELSLTSLLPTTASLPADLTTLAHSLLSQSKIRASHLKPDEEVGRTYACCHIAAERLRTKHGLELAKPRPPVPPKVYSKLKGFLEGVLNGPTTPKAGRGAGSGVSDAGKKKTPESAPTIMRKRWAEARKPKAAEQGEGMGKDVGLDVPAYAMPMIRHLCKACGTEKAAPHVYTGVSVITKQYGKPGIAEAETPSSGRKRRRGAAESEVTDIREDDIPGVILAVFIGVVARMYGARHLRNSQHFEAAVDLASDDTNGLPDSTQHADYFSRAAARFDMNDSNGAKSWTEMEWFGNVAANDTGTEPGADRDIEMQDITPGRKRPAKTPLRRKEKHGGLDDGGLERPGRAGLLPGLGTMFQPAVDWLSEERVTEHQQWRRDMERRIAAIEAGA